MKRLFMLVALGAGAAFAFLRLRGGSQQSRWQPDEYVPASPGPPAQSPVPEQPPAFADQPVPVPGPDEREQESAVTDDTRYDRLAEREQDERRTAAERLKEDPLTQQLEESGPA